MKIISIIPARSGSKRVKNKNIRKLIGLPLLTHTIKHSLNTKLIDRTIVSTDSNNYAKIAKKYGAADGHKYVNAVFFMCLKFFSKDS